MDMFSSEVKMLKNENAILQDELTRARESLEKSPGNVIPSLVEKLRNDISFINDNFYIILHKLISIFFSSLY